ncbi:ABC transporter permease [bacterium]|nr:MAG: ABC transporter permease [bacterium]
MDGFVIAAGIILAVLVFAALFAPLFAPFDPQLLDLRGGLEGPTTAHPLGQDKIGRDVLSGIMYGGRVSLLIGFAVVAVSIVVGTAVGFVSGWVGGWADEIFMRIVDILLAFPGILLAIALAGVLGPSLWNVIFALSVMGWVGFARLVRGEVLSIKEREYVKAATVLGASPARIAWKHVLPNLSGPLAVKATFAVAGTILSESSLSFLGLGPQDTPTWGAILSQGVDYLLFAPHLAFFPGLAIMLTVLGINIIGDEVSARLDPLGKHS